jgi:NAD dependent epimerase/dehydratase family enzyme
LEDGQNQKKKKIRNSRLESTKLLCQGILNLDKPQSTFICASAIGYYGSRGQEILTEESKAGEGFISDLCKDWEDSCKILL